MHATIACEHIVGAFSDERTGDCGRGSPDVLRRAALCAGACIVAGVAVVLAVTNTVSLVEHNERTGPNPQTAAELAVAFAAVAIAWFVYELQRLAQALRVRRLLRVEPWSTPLAVTSTSSTDAARSANHVFHQLHPIVVAGPHGPEVLAGRRDVHRAVGAHVRVAGTERGLAAMTDTTGTHIWIMRRAGTTSAAVTPTAPAEETASTLARRAMRSYATHALLFIIGGSLIIVASARLLVGASAHTTWLRQHGTRANAVVSATQYQCYRCDTYVQFTYFYNGKSYTARVEPTGDYHVGDSEVVFFDPHHPSDAVTAFAAESNVDDPGIWALFAGGFLAVLGLIGLWRVERRHRDLLHASWSTCEWTLVHTPRRRGDVAVVRIEHDGGNSELVRLAPALVRPHHLGLRCSGFAAERNDRRCKRVLLTYEGPTPHVIDAIRPTTDAARARLERLAASPSTARRVPNANGLGVKVKAFLRV
ncbi:MAG TPA: DUF3592 domain-containing protein [Acidimicrobiia bacterium]|jgi:hypothetical protein